MLDIPTLETSRLRLRPYRLEDFEAYAAIWADPAVVRFIGGVPFTREASWPRFLRQSGLWHFLGFGSFMIEHKATGAVSERQGRGRAASRTTPQLRRTSPADRCRWGDAGWNARVEAAAAGTEANGRRGADVCPARA